MDLLLVGETVPDLLVAITCLSALMILFELVFWEEVPP